MSDEQRPAGFPPPQHSPEDRELPSSLEWARARTPARILEGRKGGSYRTRTWLELRADHAAARDAVTADFVLERDLGQEFVEKFGIFEVATRARSRHEFLTSPELGRHLDQASRDILKQHHEARTDIQVVIGDGLSAAAVVAQVPDLLPRLAFHAEARGWRLGQPFFIRNCRVGVLNVVGELLDPAVVVLLIGERPGLATAESLSAYMAYRPRPGDDDSRRNLISNIHTRGVAPEQAATRIVNLAELMRHRQLSGVALKEETTSTLDSPSSSAEQALPRGD